MSEQLKVGQVVAVYEQTKRPWESKTNWAALVMAILAFFPHAREFVSENTELSMIVGPLVFFVLRIFTKGKISIS